MRCEKSPKSVPEKPTWAVNRWVTRGVVSLELYQYDDLVKWCGEVYLKQDRADKYAIGLCLKRGIPLYQIVPDLWNAVKTEHTTKVALDSVEQRKKTPEEARLIALKSVNTRMQKYGDLPPDEAKREVYLDVLALKGQRAAALKGLDSSGWSRDKFISHSGAKKRETHANRTEDERLAAATAWKQSNLKNSKVSAIITDEYPEFMGLVVDNMDTSDVEDWYHVYCSIMSVNSLTTGDRRYNRGKHSNYESTKIPSGSTLCRSALERKFCELLDMMDDVSSFKSEPFSIKYTRLDGRERRYVPDFEVQYNKIQIIVEVKPSGQVSVFNDLKGKYLDQPILIVTEKQLRTKERLYEHFRKYLQDE